MSDLPTRDDHPEYDSLTDDEFEFYMQSDTIFYPRALNQSEDDYFIELKLFVRNHPDFIVYKNRLLAKRALGV